jgi:type I restriction enzyme M protein
MSPKGGIRPHRRFGITSNRAEVLFVDYIMEHLTPKGRAGIVVPEGIIFQSGTAYKTLRRLMVEKYLVGVISLPAGVFNPYSGVKTSILVLNRELNQRTDKIFFAKVENDGYDLGAQRRVIQKNDLPSVTESITKYLDGLRNGKSDEAEGLSFVSKEQILGSTDVGLSYDRYQKKKIFYSVYPEFKLKEFIKFERGLVYSKNDETENDGIGVLRANNIDSYTGKLNLSDIKKIRYNEKFNERQKLRKNDIFICVASGSKDHIGKACFIDEDIDYYFGGFMGVIRAKDSISPKYLFYQLRHYRFNEYLRNRIVGASINNLNTTILNEYSVPLPPIEVQEEIVQELEHYQKIIDGAKQVVDNYKPIIDIDPSWEMRELGEVCEINPKKNEVKDLSRDTDVSFVPMSDINEYDFYFVPKEIKKIKDVYNGYTYFREDDVLLAKVTPCFENGKGGICKGLLNGIGFGSSEFYVFRPNDVIISTWLYVFLFTPSFRKRGITSMTGTGGLQ